MASNLPDGAVPATPSSSRRQILIGASLLPLIVIVGVVVVAGLVRTGSASVAEFSDDPLVTCGGGGTPFRASRLRGPSVGDTVDTTSDRKLIATLHEVGRMPEVSIDDARWRLVRESKTEAQFIGRSRTGYAAVLLERHEESWRLENSGGCDAMSVSQPGLSVATIALDTRRPITPTTTELHLFVQENTCNGGVNTPKSKIVGPRSTRMRTA